MKVREDGNAEPRSEGEEGQPTIRLSAGDQKALDAPRAPSPRLWIESAASASTP